MTAHLCGDFNAWDRSAHPMPRRKDGRFSLTITLRSGQEYRFRYLLDNEIWENDPAADGYAPNPFATQDSIIRI
jgi:1,4-alpha-glucan branching enzyme